MIRPIVPYINLIGRLNALLFRINIPLKRNTESVERKAKDCEVSELTQGSYTQNFPYFSLYF